MTLLGVVGYKEIELRCIITSLKNNVEKGYIVITFRKTEDQVADIFTKTLGQEYFQKNWLSLISIFSLTNQESGIG